MTTPAQHPLDTITGISAEVGWRAAAGGITGAALVARHSCASVGQDVMARTIGRCRHGLEIDREFGTQIGGGQPAAFTYVRYEADISECALAKACVDSAKKRAKVRALDAVGEIGDLEDIGARAAEALNIDRHLAGFL